MGFNNGLIALFMGNNKPNKQIEGIRITTSAINSDITYIYPPTFYKNIRKVNIYIWSSSAGALGKDTGGGGGGFMLLQLILRPYETCVATMRTNNTTTAGYFRITFKGNTYQVNQGGNGNVNNGGTVVTNFVQTDYAKVLAYENGQNGDGNKGGNVGGISYLYNLYTSTYASQLYGIGGQNSYNGYTNTSNNGRPPGGGAYDDNSGTTIGAGAILFIPEYCTNIPTTSILI